MITPSAAPHLFHRFFRASNVQDDSISGMGIGLYVVREIVRCHGGNISVDSTIGVGSTVTVRLPRPGQAAPLA